MMQWQIIQNIGKLRWWYYSLNCIGYFVITQKPSSTKKYVAYLWNISIMYKAFEKNGHVCRIKPIKEESICSTTVKMQSKETKGTNILSTKRKGKSNKRTRPWKIKLNFYQPISCHCYSTKITHQPNKCIFHCIWLEQCIRCWIQSTKNLTKKTINQNATNKWINQQDKSVNNKLAMLNCKLHTFCWTYFTWINKLGIRWCHDLKSPLGEGDAELAS